MNRTLFLAFLGGLVLLLLASCAAQPETAENETTSTVAAPVAASGTPGESSVSAPDATQEQQPVAQDNAPPSPTPPQQATDMYRTYCAACHGDNGQGTPAAVALNTSAVREMQQSELEAIIRSGVPGTAMAGWQRVLTPQQTSELASYVQTWESPATVSADAPPTATPPDPTDPQAVQTAGARLYATYCASCHGDNGSGGLGPALNSQQFLSRFDDATIREAILYGGWHPDSQMPAYGSHMTSAEIETLVNYIRAWEPTAPSVPDFRGEAMAERGQGQGPGQGRGQGQGQGPGQGRGQGQGQGRGQGQQHGEAMQYTGDVLAVERALLRVQTDEGEEIGVLLGPPWYWQEAGITLEAGDRVQLEAVTPRAQAAEGFYLRLNWLENLDTGARYVLHNSDGTPAFRP
jgi:mono/diheme cytochrome c family protein